MRFLFFRSKAQGLFDRLLEAERNPHGPVTMGNADGREGLPEDLSVLPLSEAEELRFRRILAIMHYGEEGEDLAGRKVLTQGEQDGLDAYVIRQRWARFRASQMKSGWTPYH